MSIAQLIDIFKDLSYPTIHFEELINLTNYMTDNFLKVDDDCERDIFIQREFPKYAVLVLMSDHVYAHEEHHVLASNILFCFINITAGHKEIYSEVCVKSGVLDAVHKVIKEGVNDYQVADVRRKNIFLKL